MDTATLATVSAHQRDERPDYRQLGRDGLKGLLKMQSVLLDFYAEQNAIAFKMVRERVGAAPSAPSTALIDSIEESVENIVAAQ